MSLRSLIVYLVVVSSAVVLAQEKRTLAILDFSNNSIAQRAEMEPLSQGLADIFTTGFSRIDAFTVVERQNIRKVITELQFQQSEFVDPEKAQRMGKILGAEFLVLGGFVHSFGGDLRIDLRIVEVESGRTVRGEEATGDLDDLFDVVEELTMKITRYFKVGFPESFDADMGPESKKTALLFARAVIHEDRASDLLAAGKTAAAAAELEKALSLLRDVLNESPGFKDAEEKQDRLTKRLSALR